MSKIYAGFGRYDITPQEYMEMSGFGNDHERISTVVLDHVFGTCIALRDETGKTVLLCTSDLLNAYTGSVVENVRESIHAATGVPKDHIMCAVVHNHSGPSPSRINERTSRYVDYYTKQMTRAAVDAINDLSEATISIASKVGERLTFDRHYFTNDGKPFGTRLGSIKSGIKCHMDKADEQIQLIRFCRKEGRDILLTNWQAHVTMVGKVSTDTEISADYVGAYRDHLEGSTGCKVAFFQGGAGNLGPGSRIKEELRVEPGDYRGYGRLLAELALEALAENTKPVNVGPIRTKQLIYAAEVDHSEDHLAPAALEARELYNAAVDLPPAERIKIMTDRGFKTHLHAASIINRYKADPFTNVELNAIAVGDISFVTAPFEMFCSVPVHIKANTPYEMTFFMGYCNGSLSYLADKKGFQYQTYEVQSRRFVEGTAENIGQTHLDMLKELKEEN